MSVITTHLTIAPDGTVSTEQPLPAGEYVAQVQSKDRFTPPTRPLRIEDWPKLQLTPRNPNATFSREEIYGDDMR